MTNREFFVSVSKGIVGEAEVAHALEQIAKLDATNAKRAEKAKEKATGNEPIKTAIFNLLTEKGGMTSPDIAEALKVQGVTTAEGEEISTCDRNQGSQEGQAEAVCRGNHGGCRVINGAREISPFFTKFLFRRITSKQ